MTHLTKLFHILEITRMQPQTGYAIWGGDMRLGNLAEHHYMVAMIAWQLAANANSAGAKLDIGKTLEFALLHDIGELFGGDISMPYAKSHPDARTLAKKFEAENQSNIAKYFGPEEKHIKARANEILDADSDEARVVKVADYLEVTHYKYFVNAFIKADVDLVADKLAGMIGGMKDGIASKKLGEFIESWKKEMNSTAPYRDTISDIISGKK